MNEFEPTWRVVGEESDTAGSTSRPTNSNASWALLLDELRNTPTQPTLSSRWRQRVRRGHLGHHRCHAPLRAAVLVGILGRSRNRRGDRRMGGAVMFVGILQLSALVIVAVLMSVIIVRLAQMLLRVDEIDERVAFLEPLFDIQRCRVCNCTDDVACMSACWWVTADLCSSCADDEVASASSLEGGGS